MKVMRPVQCKGCTSRASHHQKPTPSKWDDAQKWLVNLSRGEHSQPAKATLRNSSADDRRLITAPVCNHDEYLISEDEPGKICPSSTGMIQHHEETKMVNCDGSVWRISCSESLVRSMNVRDLGTQMTTDGSQELSRTATTSAARSSISSTPAKCQNAVLLSLGNGKTSVASAENRTEANRRVSAATNQLSAEDFGENKKPTPLETCTMAWGEAERAKYMARYKREEVKIQAWEDHERRKAEMEMQRIEAKGERLKSRAHEKYRNKLAAARRIAEEKHAKAEAKLNEKTVKTSAKANYIRQTGHLPSFLSFKLPKPCFCW